MPDEEKNVTETPVTPTPEEVETFLAEAQVATAKAQQEAERYRTLYQAEYTEQMVIDREDRDDEDLRLEMVRLVERIGELITESAEKLAIKRGGLGDPFEADVAESEICWQLAEFVTMSMIDRDDEMYEAVPHRGQYDKRHAMFWFMVDETFGEPPLLFVRKKAKPSPYSLPYADEEGDQDETEVRLHDDTAPEPPDDAPELRLVS